MLVTCSVAPRLARPASGDPLRRQSGSFIGAGPNAAARVASSVVRGLLGWKMSAKLTR